MSAEVKPSDEFTPLPFGLSVGPETPRPMTGEPIAMVDASDEIEPVDKYVRTEIGSIGCDDDSFCGIVLTVGLVDSGEPRKRFGEKVKGERSDDTPPWIYDMPVSEPIHVRIDWEQNCTSEPGMWMGQRTALRLAHLLIEAALREPVAHRMEGIE